jgi:hypothetical protein
MFYALENDNPNFPDHPWNEKGDPRDRGLGAHIDYWLRVKNSPGCNIHVWDGNETPKRVRGLIVGRRGDEEPFKSQGPNAVGLAGAGCEIYIRTDYALWVLGKPMTEKCEVQTTDGVRCNITYLIAHEAGHFFGFPHVDDAHSIMNPQLTDPPDDRPRWQLPYPSMDVLFTELAQRIVDNGPRK